MAKTGIAGAFSGAMPCCRVNVVLCPADVVAGELLCLVLGVFGVRCTCTGVTLLLCIYELRYELAGHEAF